MPWPPCDAHCESSQLEVVEDCGGKRQVIYKMLWEQLAIRRSIESKEQRRHQLDASHSELPVSRPNCMMEGHVCKAR